MNILISGPESTGKSTLSEELSAHYDCRMVPEYARDYLLENGAAYDQDDIITIAKRHYQIYKNNTLYFKPIVFDTYLLNLKIWYEVKYGVQHPWIIEKLKEADFKCVLLMKPDLPWEEGPFRENQNGRDKLFLLFKEGLDQLNWRYHVVGGLEKKRLTTAIKIIDSYRSQ